MARDPLLDLDDGNCYGGQGVANPDCSGATRVGLPDLIRPGVSLKPVPKGIHEHVGTFGRVNLNENRRIVEPTALPFDPTRHAGVVPARLNAPRGTLAQQVGSTGVEVAPAHRVLSTLKIKGCQPWMFAWAEQRYQQWQGTDESILRQVAMLHRYGDAIAERLYHHMQRLNVALQRAYAARRAPPPPMPRI